MEIGKAMAGELHCGRKGVTGVAQHLRGAALPVGVIVAAVDAGDALVAGGAAGAEGEIDPMAVLASLRRGICQPIVRREIETLPAFDRRPGLRRSPSLR